MPSKVLSPRVVGRDRANHFIVLARSRPHFVRPLITEFDRPFSSYKNFVIAFRARSKMVLPADPVKMEAEMRKWSDAQETTLKINVEHVFDDERFDRRVKDMVIYGVALGIAGGLAVAAACVVIGGSAGGVYGLIIGAAVGIIVGITVAVFPFSRYDLRSRWRSFVASLVPIERYALFHSFRKGMDSARTKCGYAPVSSWMLTQPDASFNDFSGVDSLVASSFEDLFITDCCPDPLEPSGEGKFEHEGPVTQYMLGLMCCESADGHTLDQTRMYQFLQGGFGSEWLRIASRRYARFKVGDIRKWLVTDTDENGQPMYGMKDVDHQPFPQHFADLVAARDAELNAAAAARAKK